MKKTLLREGHKEKTAIKKFTGKSVSLMTMGNSTLVEDVLSCTMRKPANTLVNLVSAPSKTNVSTDTHHNSALHGKAKEDAKEDVLLDPDTLKNIQKLLF